MFYVVRLMNYQPPKYFQIVVPWEYEMLAWIIGCTGLLQVPIGAVSAVVENIKVRPCLYVKPQILHLLDGVLKSFSDYVVLNRGSSGFHVPSPLKGSVGAVLIRKCGSPDVDFTKTASTFLSKNQIGA